MFNLLFEPSLTIPDTFFFTNRFLIRHIEDDGAGSLFLRAVANGLIVPAFRYETDLSFQESLRSTARDNAGGMEESDYRKLSPAVLAMQLDDAYDEAGSATGGAPRRVWPSDLGSLFGAGFESVLLNDSPPTTDEALLARWQRIRRWRHESTSPTSGCRRAISAHGTTSHPRSWETQPSWSAPSTHHRRRAPPSSPWNSSCRRPRHCSPPEAPSRVSPVIANIAAGGMGAVSAENFLSPQYALVSGLAMGAATYAVTTTVELFSGRKHKVSTRPETLHLTTGPSTQRELNLAD